jgi:two-component system chemotaxis sensor kinase CheA
MIFAVMLLGNRVGLFWTVVSAAQVIALFILHKNGIEVPDDTVKLDRPEALFSAAATAFVAYYLLARVYENLKTQMLSEIAESKLAAERAHASARTVLDNVDQGLLIARLDGRMEPERSEAVVRWFGASDAEETVFTFLGRVDRRFGRWLEAGWQQIVEDFLPLELALHQLPKRFTHGERQFSVSYRPILVEGKVGSMLLVITDITALLAAEHAEEQQRELLSILQRVMVDHEIVLEFMEETHRRVQALTRVGEEASVELRELHTIKGNVSMFGISTTARYCHELETRLLDENRRLTPEERIGLVNQWLAVSQRLRPVLGETRAQVELSKQEYEDALQAVVSRESYPELESRMHGWAHEPTQKRLYIYAEQLRAIATRLGKPEPTVRIDDGGVRLPKCCLGEFWANLQHVIRNAVDHGLESTDERRAAGKTEHGEIVLSTRVEQGNVVIEIADDGRGIDWNRVAARAKGLGLPAHTAEDLENALFVDGLTTKDETTEVSGRGVGLSAVKGVVTAIGGRTLIASAFGRGTRFQFVFPFARLRPSYNPRAA